MHRESNLQVENEETIEAQSARTPKRCWTESNSAFSFARGFLPRFNARATADSAWRFAFAAPHLRAYSLSSFVFPFSHTHPRTARSRAHTVRAYPVGVRKKRPLHSAFADRAVGEMVGSPPTSRMQKMECG